ncbi:MAG: queuosine salvage family protein [Vicinamibacterales bacterium]
MERRTFLHTVGAAAALPLSACSGTPQTPAPSDASRPAGHASGPMRHPLPIGSPVLDSLKPVIEQSTHVRTNVDKIVEHAGWLAYDELPFPQMAIPFGLEKNVEQAIDFAMVTNTVNTAFTDFTTSVKFQIDYDGRRRSDSEAMTACFMRALAEKVPILDGRYLATLTREQLVHVFRGGNIEMPMLDEKLAALREVGQVLVQKYGGFFHNFIASCSKRLYDHGNGLVDKLVQDFPRFNDVSRYKGAEVKFYKLTQLGYWGLYSSLRPQKAFPIEDIDTMTAFADYIVPVAMRVMNILEYTPELDKAIADGKELPRDSDEEIEIRAHMLHATALLREEINKRRPADLQIIIPQLDARLWISYHATHWPHHLTRTTMY